VLAEWKTIWSLLEGYLSERIENMILKRYLQPYVHYSMIFVISTRLGKVKCPSVDEQIKKMRASHTRGYQPTLKEKEFCLV
jgi:hypothetical protein